MKRYFLLCLLLLFFWNPDSIIAQQTDTQITIRALAVDAKFVGTSMGGAKVTITDLERDSVLAEGFTSGSTGNTNTLVKKPHGRYDTLSTQGDAKFQTTLALSEPTFVRIAVTGPMEYPSSAVTVTQQRWIIPGHDITGDGIVIQLPGFVLNAKQGPSTYRLDKSEIEIPVTATMVMMCGCPIEDGGLWDSEPMKLEAQLIKDGEPVKRNSLTFTGTTNTFSTAFNVSKTGSYQVRITAFDPRSFNTAVETVQFVVK